MQMRQAVRFFGTQDNIAEALGISQAAVGKWGEMGVPILRQIQLEYLSCGKLKASKRELGKLGIALIIFRNSFPQGGRKAA